MTLASASFIRTSPPRSARSISGGCARPADARRDPRRHGRVRRPRLSRPDLQRRTSSLRLRPAPRRRAAHQDEVRRPLQEEPARQRGPRRHLNVDENGEILQSDDRRRMYGLGNRLWHTDASFQDPPGRYSMLSARSFPPSTRTPSLPTCARRTTRCPTEKGPARGPARPPLHRPLAADARLRVLGEEEEKLEGAVHPARAHHPRSHGGRSTWPRTPRASWTGPCPRGASSSRDLIEHATQPDSCTGTVARRRPRDLGQPRHHAPRAALRRRQVPPRAATRHHARHRAARPP